MISKGVSIGGNTLNIDGFSYQITKGFAEALVRSTKMTVPVSLCAHPGSKFPESQRGGSILASP